MKKLILIMVCMIFAISLVSAFEFDNVKSYDLEKKEITIINAFGLGDDIATITLDTPLVLRVVDRGNVKQKVAEFTINNVENYGEVFQKLEFYDINKDDKKFTREFEYKYKTTYTVNEPVYESSCSPGKLLGNGSISLDCSTEQVGTKDRIVDVWNEFDEKLELGSGVITIGIFTNVISGDNVEWIPTLYGVEIDEWAAWTAELNIDLVSYWNMEVKNSTFIEDAVAGVNNFSNMSGSPTNASGIIFDGINVTNSAIINETVFDDDGFVEMSWSVWYYKDDNAGKILTQGVDGRVLAININTANAVQFQVDDDGSNPILTSDVLADDNWYHIVAVAKSGDTSRLYINGTQVDNSSIGTLQAATNRLVATMNINGGERLVGTLDEIGYWNRTLTDQEVSDLYNNGNGITFITNFTTNPVVTLNSPSIASNHTNPVFLNCSATDDGDVINITLIIDDVANSTAAVSSGSFEQSLELNLTSEFHTWNCEATDNDNNVANATSSNNFSVFSAVEQSQSFNSTTLETDGERFIVNFTKDPTLTITPTFTYAGVNRGSGIDTGTGNSTDAQFFFDLTIPTNVGSQNFNWIINNTNFTHQTQTVNEINFDTCNATLTARYLNITFFNETLNQEVTNATITGTWYYSLFAQTTNKSLTLTNATENHKYNFCFNEANRTINMDYSIAYNNGESQQRLFGFAGLLTNITTITDLFLLPTSAGLFSPFSTVFANGDSIDNVKAVITRTLGASIVTITSGFTDSSGFITFFLNPDISYSAVFSKTGFSDNLFSFTPTTQTRTVTMGGQVGSISNGTTILGNTSYNILPVNTTLNNNTDFTFGFNVTSSQPITLISMNITNATGFQVLFLSNAGTGFISQTLNTGENQTFIGRFLIQTATETISVTKRWQIGDLFIGDYSIYRQFTLFVTYGFRDFIKFLIVLSVIMGTLIFMSRNELVESSESKIMVALLLIWGFSIVGWLNTGIITNSDTSGINKLAELSNQFGVAFLSTAGGMFFILRRIFIRRI